MAIRPACSSAMSTRRRSRLPAPRGSRVAATAPPRTCLVAPGELRRHSRERHQGEEGRKSRADLPRCESRCNRVRCRRERVQPVARGSPERARLGSHVRRRRAHVHRSSARHGSTVDVERIGHRRHARANHSLALAGRRTTGSCKPAQIHRSVAPRRLRDFPAAPRLIRRRRSLPQACDCDEPLPRTYSPVSPSTNSRNRSA